MNLLRAFPALRPKEGYALRAYQYRDDGDGNGFVWAVPESAPFPDPETFPRVEGAFLQPPKPPGVAGRRRRGHA
jgi:hypothetical protein